MLECFGNAHDERAVDAAGVAEAFAAGEHTAVVGVVDHDSTVGEAVLFKFSEALTDLFIHVLDRIRVLGVGLADLGQVRVIGEQLHRSRIVPGILVVAVSTALVTIADIDDSEKRLVCFPLFPPVGGAFSFADIPGVVVIAATDVVVGLAGVGCVISGLSQQVRIIRDPVVRNFITASHRLSAVGDAIHARDPAGTSRGTDGSVIEAVAVAKSIGGELIDIRGPGIRPPVGTHPGDAIVFAGDPENVGLLLRVQFNAGYHR